MASKSLSNEQRVGLVGAVSSLVLISPPAAACATVGWVAHEAYAWYQGDDEPKDLRRD